GSYQVDGQSALDLRALFPGRAYAGVDLRAGPGVDCTADVESLPQATHSAGTVIAMNTFEHVRRFWNGFAEVQRVLRPDGVFVVPSPFSSHTPHSPDDYWRFTRAALEALLDDSPSKITGWHGARQRPAHVGAVAFGPARPAITPEQFARHRRLVQQYAH